MIRLYRISACKWIDGEPGLGAFLAGGRWNSKGTRLIYTAENSALCMLESLAHISMLRLSEPYCMQIFDVPDDITVITARELPFNWRENPAPDSLKVYGDHFASENKALVLKVPSVLVEDGNNYLINPLHPLFKEVKKVAMRNISFDQRLLTKFQ